MKTKIELHKQNLNSIKDMIRKNVDSTDKICSDLEDEISGAWYDTDHKPDLEKCIALITQHLDECSRTYKEVKGFVFTDEKTA